MSIEKVRAFLKTRDMENRIQEFSVSSATVELAAAALGVDGARIAKTLSFLLPEGPVLVVAAGDGRVDNHKFKETFHSKAKMIPAGEVETLVGHSVGGVCPFAIELGVKVYLDESLRRFRTVFPACGSSNSAIELTLPELESLSSSVGWVDVCKDWA